MDQDVFDQRLWASGLPVQAGRKHFAFMEWSDFEPETWKAVRSEAMVSISPVETPIFASDQHPVAVRQTMESLEEPTESLVQIKQTDFFKMEPLTDHGVLVFNPPYGERMDP